MQKISDLQQIHRVVTSFQEEGESVGVVPTMGALHEGHLSLVREAQQRSDRVVVTIFLNPTQFSPSEDLAKYPQQMDEDLKKLVNLGVDVVFSPQKEDIYPAGFSTYVEPPMVASRWEGERRTTHFRGVATVVLKLLHLIPAQRAFFGQKDFQQTLVIKRMVQDLNLPVEIVVCPIIREVDGLAMSSRNTYLSPEERKTAVCLFQGLQRVQDLIKQGSDPPGALAAAKELVAKVDELEYFELVDAETLNPATDCEGPRVVLIAARVGTTRLIDNLLLEP